jgi:hypothetical protein
MGSIRTGKTVNLVLTVAVWNVLPNIGVKSAKRKINLSVELIVKVVRNIAKDAVT